MNKTEFTVEWSLKKMTEAELLEEAFVLTELNEALRAENRRLRTLIKDKGGEDD